MKYSRPLRILHIFSALTISYQLIVSLFMERPRLHGGHTMTSGGGFLFASHEWVGLVAVGVLFIGWVYRFVNWKRENQARLFPWLSRAGAITLASEVMSFIKFRWENVPENGALAGTIHGLGLLAATAMALTGGILFIQLYPANLITPSTHLMMELHSFFSTFMWAYLYGHGLMALWHEFIGDKALSKMFRLA